MELYGIGAAKGKAVGKVVILDSKKKYIEKKSIVNYNEELTKFRDARIHYENELKKLYKKTEEEVGKDEAEIFNSYIEMLNDDVFFEKPIQRVKHELINIEYAIDEEKKKVTSIFMEMDDKYLKDRACDIENVCNELINYLIGNKTSYENINNISEDFILIADDLTPSDTIRINKKYIKGFIIEKGGQTSHTVILAKTLGIPAIIGVKDILRKINVDDLIYMDGKSGKLIINPEEHIIREYLESSKKILELNKKINAVINKPAITRDGFLMHICINAGSVEDIKNFEISSCDGIGLFRTEFLYMAEREYPSEEKQYKIYKMIAEKVKDKGAIIRTLDIGGDKRIDYMDLPIEDNPFLGYRAIRICLDRREMFKVQLRAILRASVFGKLSIMLPMIVNIEELRKSKKILNECMNELKDEGLSYNENIKVGIMIETPAAVLLSDCLAREADFFSIGTNDLVQYITATDRMNTKIQYLYNVCNISVIKAIKTVVDNAHSAGIPVGICGEAASDEKMVPLWVGLGIDELSMVSGQSSRIKYAIDNIDKLYAEEITKNILKMNIIEDVEKTLSDFMKENNILE